jgi:MFS family permease
MRGNHSYRSIIASALLFSTTLSWFFIFNSYLLNSMLQNSGEGTFFTSLGNLLFYSFAVVFGIIGSILSEGVERTKFLRLWAAFGFFTTIVIVVFQGPYFALFLSALLGISFGLGFPTVQAFFTEATTYESRGKVAGITAILTLTIAVVVLLLITFLQLTIVSIVLICACLKAASFPALAKHINKEEGLRMAWKPVLFSPDFISYATPWLIFNLANGLGFFARFPEEIQSVASLGPVLEFLAAIFAAVVGGILADRNGRKQPLIFGLIVLGTGYAFFGVLSSAETYLIYSLVDGAAWGLLVVTYMQVILGDLSSRSGVLKERFFALGGIMIPFLTRSIFQAIQAITGLTIAANYLYTILCFLIFVSIIPVWRAAETLPDSITRERKMREHIDKVGKLVDESKKK